jgi:hypothetical protein
MEPFANTEVTPTIPVHQQCVFPAAARPVVKDAGSVADELVLVIRIDGSYYTRLRV